jgi:hypothetical protein
MDPAIKPGSTRNGSLPVLGHTPNSEGQYSSYVTPKMLEEQKLRQLQADLDYLKLKEKKNK